MFSCLPWRSWKGTKNIYIPYVLGLGTVRPKTRMTYDDSFKLSYLLFQTNGQNLARLNILYLHVLRELSRRGCLHSLSLIHNIWTELPFTPLECTRSLLGIHLLSSITGMLKKGQLLLCQIWPLWCHIDVDCQYSGGKPRQNEEVSIFLCYLCLPHYFTFKQLYHVLAVLLPKWITLFKLNWHLVCFYILATQNHIKVSTFFNVMLADWDWYHLFYYGV